MDDYPAGDPIPDVDGGFRGQHNDLMEFLSNSREMRETARNSVKQAAFAGGGALAGGVLLGPVGGLIGGIAGSIIGFLNSDGYDGALMSISKLDDGEKKVLMKRVGAVLVAAGAAAQQLDSGVPSIFKDALLNYASQPKVREDLWKACVYSLQK